MMSYRNMFVLTFICGLFLFAALSGQSASDLQHHKIARISGADSISFCICLPESYSDGDLEYPIVYHLHGMDGYYGGWQSQWMADFFREEARNKEVPEVILVFPDGKDGFWGNHYDGDPMLESDLFDELIPYMDRTFRTDKQKRMIMGWSAGAPGALFFFTKHPDIFKGVVSLDGALLSWEEMHYFQPERTDQITNSDSLYFYEYFSPYRWIEKNSKALAHKEGTPMFIAASYFNDYHKQFLSLLASLGIPVTYMELNCEHDFSCVLTGVSAELLVFVSALFAQ